MCGRFAQHRPTPRIREQFRIPNSFLAPTFNARYNVCPGQAALLVRVGYEDKISLESWLWGFKPKWMKDERSGPINARAETVHEKPMFRYAFQSQRCLVVADAWYEWRLLNGRKQPYAIKPGREISFAGIWDTASFAIITTEAADEIRYIHDRMPAIIDPKDYDQWLRGTPDDARELLRPYHGQIEHWPVSTYVNRPINNDERCLEPIHLG
jgi:putative SOS response-associated peptidase YedK